MNDKLCVHYAVYRYAAPHFWHFCFPGDQSRPGSFKYNASILIMSHVFVFNVLIFNI